MNLNLKCIFICVTANRRWGKALDPITAIKNAGLKPNAKTEHYIMAAVLNEPNDEELEKLRCCITVEAIDGSPCYYYHNRTEEDDALIGKFHVGWSMVFSNIKKS